MINEKLAIYGGEKIINRSLKPYSSIGKEELQAASKVIESGLLSKYLARWHEDFFGGPKVQKFERMCEEYFGVKHAVTVNSWTSGLIAAVGAVGIEPGDEVIVPPWTMCASATSILHWNAIPVFADIEPDTFCIDPDSVKANITSYTKAIVAVDIFGHSANMEELKKIAREHELKLISDSAQSPGGFYKGKHTGTIADVGGYSLNCHKHIHTGEGGIIVTDDDQIAERLQLIRNHGEAVVASKGEANLVNMIGHNFRLGEIECAIGIEQLKKLENLVASRQKAAQRLTEGLGNLSGMRVPIVKRGCTHTYYVYPMVIDFEKLGISRDLLIRALEAEGVFGLTSGYVNLHMFPMYQEKIAYGSKGFPWSSELCRRDIDYSMGICPVAEEMHNHKFVGMQMCLFELNDNDLDSIVRAFHKVWANIDTLISNQ